MAGRRKIYQYIKINKAEKTGTCAHCNSQFLIEEAIKRKIPIYGFCRGMQSILHYFGNELIQVFRIKQWEEHKRNIWDQLKQHLIDLFNESQETFYLDVLQIMEEFERGNNVNTSN